MAKAAQKPYRHSARLDGLFPDLSEIATFVFNLETCPYQLAAFLCQNANAVV